MFIKPFETPQIRDLYGLGCPYINNYSLPSYYYTVSCFFFFNMLLLFSKTPGNPSKRYLYLFICISMLFSKTLIQNLMCIIKTIQSRMCNWIVWFLWCLIKFFIPTILYRFVCLHIIFLLKIPKKTSSLSIDYPTSTQLCHI